MRGHEIHRLDRAQRDDVVVAARVADHPYRAHREEYGEGLADLVVEPVGAQLLDEDGVGQAQGIGVVLAHLAEDAHAEAGPREGVAIDHVGGQAEFDPDLAHLVLEQFAQRLDELEVHALRQPAHVVVRLDHVRLAGGRAGRLDHVRVDRALGEPAHALDPRGLLLEDLDEQAADDLALAFRVGHALERIEEAFFGVDAQHAHAHVFREGGHYLVTLVQAQQAVVHEHAGQSPADGPVQQRRHHRGVHAARERKEHRVVADRRAHPPDAVVDDLRRGPERAAAADLVHEAPEDARALAGMGDLGVELQPVEAAFVVGHTRERRAVGGRDDLEARRQGRDPVAVAHPYIEQSVALGARMVLDVAQQARVTAHAHLGVAVLALAGGLHLPAELCGHRLHAVADTEHRYAEFKDRFRHARRGGLRDRLRPPREHDAARGELTHAGGVHVEGHDLAIHARLTHAARNQLRVLGSEVQDQDTFGMNIGHGWREIACRTDGGSRGRGRPRVRALRLNRSGSWGPLW
ncbi:hypothetical protein BMS3Abin12_02215 [bacterium BMS3Abin12]|nr:hypothetical protein BMS3Abin12_02215 [bacterium BMS3Abin12]